MISKGWTFPWKFKFKFYAWNCSFFLFRKKSTPCVMTSGKLSNSHGKNISCRCRRHVKIISFNGSVQQTNHPASTQSSPTKRNREWANAIVVMVPMKMWKSASRKVYFNRKSSWKYKLPFGAVQWKSLAFIYTKSF